MQIYLEDGIWYNTKKVYPMKDGWYLVVIDGHGTRHRKVDWYEVDDVQWKSEHEDGSVNVTHFMKLPQMPEEKK